MQAIVHAAEHCHAPARMSWARLLKGVFDIDIERCPNCAGRLKIIAVIEDAPVIVRIFALWACPRARRRALWRNESICSRRLEPSTQTGSATEPAVALGRCSGKRPGRGQISSLQAQQRWSFPPNARIADDD